MGKILIIGINEKIHTTQKIINELERKNIPFLFIKWGSLVFKNDNLFSQNQPIDIKEFDMAFFDIPSYKLATSDGKIKFRLTNELLELAKILRKNKIRLINGDFMIEYPFYNKFVQSIIFSRLNISSIPTVHLSDNGKEKVLSALEKFHISFPVVIKQSEGGMGQNVWKAENDKELEEIISPKRNESLVYQPMIKNGGDYRVLVIGGKSLGIMKRTAKGSEWKNNFALGGEIERYADKNMEKFAEEVAKKMNLDYAGIDIFKKDDAYQVIEVNIFACFEGFEKMFPEINIPETIINFLKK